MARLKASGDGDVAAVLDGLDDETKRADSERLIALMRAATGEEPALWGGSIIGFGRYHYRYDSGHSGEAPLVAFSPRKSAISLYLGAPAEQRADLLGRLGKHRSGASCVYVKRLSDIDEKVLGEFIDATIALTRAQDTGERD